MLLQTVPFTDPSDRSFSLKNLVGAMFAKGEANGDRFPQELGALYFPQEFGRGDRLGFSQELGDGFVDFVGHI